MIAPSAQREREHLNVDETIKAAKERMKKEGARETLGGEKRGKRGRQAKEEIILLFLQQKYNERQRKRSHTMLCFCMQG